MEVGYLLCLLSVLIYSSGCYGQGNCVKKSDCICQFSDGTRINLESIAKRNEFAFPYQKDQSGLGSYEYAYNPCYPVTDTDDCKDVAACQRDPNSEAHFSIGDATSARFLGKDDSITIGYSSDSHGTSKVLTVTLVCDQSATTPQLLVQGEDPGKNSYQYTLTSKCCCPGGCDGTPPPPTGGPGGSGGLSLGSILCIAFTCLVVVYLVAGVIFMKFVKHAEGKEAIPNYSFWSDLPSLIKGGCIFTYSKFLQLIGRSESKGYESM